MTYAQLKSMQETQVWLRKRSDPLRGSSNMHWSVVLETQPWKDTYAVSMVIHKMPIMKCFFRHNVWSMFQMWSRRKERDCLFPALPSTFICPNLFFDISSMWAWWRWGNGEVMVFVVGPCVSVFFRQGSRVQLMQTTRITAFDIHSTETGCLSHTMCIAQQHCCYMLTE